MKKFDLFVYRRSVQAKSDGGHRPVNLEERVYRLLVMFLRYKDHHLPTIQLYGKAWQHNWHDEQYNEKDIVEGHLKPAVAQLRRDLMSVVEFEIPDKKRDSGYICRGEFSCCVIVPERDERAFRLEL